MSSRPLYNNQGIADFVFDVAVIGGGPAGMMAAGRTAERGLNVILLEKNKTLGKKLLITGGGRCNMTNYEPDIRKFLEKLKDSGKFLFSAFSQFGVIETLDFFHNRNLQTKVEEWGRVFPVTNKSESVFNILEKYMEEGGVKISSGSAVKRIIYKKNKTSNIAVDDIDAIELENGEIIHAISFILATGGMSRPETGSTGDGFAWLEKLGHTVNQPSPSLVPIAIKDPWVKSLQGVTLPDVKITVYQDKVKRFSKKGRILFTHFGVSGPTIINMSKDIGELMNYGSVTFSTDIFPSLGYDMLNVKLLKLFDSEKNRKFINALESLIPISGLCAIIANLSKINPDIFCNSITKADRMKLVKLLKDIPMDVEGLLGAEKAIVTSGGVDLTEVDFKSMKSKIISNLYFAGDILDIDRPSGGYSLQLCWTTGYVAGNSIQLE